MSKITVKPVDTLKEDIAISIPASKSHSHRAILLASMACGRSKICNVLSSPDVVAMINGCSLMGAKIIIQGDTLYIEGVDGLPRAADEKIDANNSGQVLRFLSAMLAITEGQYAINGDESIQKIRPIAPLTKALNDLGANCVLIGKDKSSFPLMIKGPIKPGKALLDGEDSQPVSALLMAAAFLKGETIIDVTNPKETPWIDLTLSWLDRLGIDYQNDRYEHYKVFGKASVEGFDFVIPGDFSSALYPIVTAIILKTKIVVEGLDFRDSQGDRKVVDLLIKMGADIRINTSQNTLTVVPVEKIYGQEIDVDVFIDALPLLAVLGCFAEGETNIFNGKIARKKESDRIHAICEELKKMGAEIEEKEDGLIVKKSSLKGGVLDGHKDHRIVMSLFIAATAAKGESSLTDVEYVKKSFPNFFDIMQKLGVEARGDG